MRMPVQPASLRQFVLLSFFMALIPLGVLLWQSHSALSDVSRYAIAEAESSVTNVRRAENMQKLVNDIERSVLQFSILKTDALSQLAATHLNNYQQNLGSVCLNLNQPELCAKQQQQLELLFNSYLHESNEELSPILQKIRQQQVQLTQVIWALLEQRLQQQQVYAEEAQGHLAWQTVALVVLTLLLVLWASARITAPVKMLDTMIRSIGQASHHFPHDKVDGPRELTELGEQLRWLASRLQQLEALRLILLRHASHELKTPLSSIREGCALLSEQLVGPLNPQQMEVVSLLNGSADRLSVLTEQLLDYNKLLQQAKPEFDWHDSETLLQNCFNDHALSLQQREQKIVLDCQLPRLYTDSMLFRRILDNLINNAQAYGAEGSNVWVNLRQHDKFMLLDVANNGTPIPAELRAKLFEPFQRGKAPRFDSIQGSGLGLSIVADCARLLGGLAEIIDVSYADVCIQVRLPLVEDVV
ncbi:MAG: HAMP domain-containing histidine kinase [Gammaproteobacteria bacterium]|nr:HAMP domain-containing histidine kinase [Gammaproteobacteria bacterium]MBU2056816.1 HAMP domain-containing histidine kinase [Gammaproteobacteria bacterium]MBU2174652.1 HAMP domain-containing histidine kinase [Gammaproteobacteria bacterium]MBU2248345.1 HAMP domain-containing histidine kinase [Gammaproteobacteria bacterium]MBU2346214.1 HAMP domain-containing histidine kinase [Gammaproteobacteria bacterium]